MDWHKEAIENQKRIQALEQKVTTITKEVASLRRMLQKLYEQNAKLVKEYGRRKKVRGHNLRQS